MKNTIWTNAIKTCADPQRARNFLDLLAATNAGAALRAASAEQARILAALFSGSQALSNLLVARPDWLGVLEPEALKFPRRKQGLRNEVSRWLKPLLAASDFGAALGACASSSSARCSASPGATSPGWATSRRPSRRSPTWPTSALDAVWQICHRQLTGRHGQPWHQDAGGKWQPTSGCVFGMGKLGGQELNYSSDVDVLFVYSEEGSVFKEPPAKSKTPAANADEPPVLQSPGRGLHRGGEPHDAGRRAVSD